MKHRKCNHSDIISVYQHYYSSIHGGIDGYYEKTMLDYLIYEIYTTETIGFFSVHPERGLTSLVVLPNYYELYEEIFLYVIKLPLFTNILFSGDDTQFMNQMKKYKIEYEIQAYNFILNKKVTSSIQMKEVTEKDFDRINKDFGEFILYNQMSLDKIKTFYYEENNDLISFGALEPLRLNKNRFCIAMIVSDKYRSNGYGCQTVKFLLEYLQSKKLECNARCYVHNEALRRTLLKSGLIISNYLFKAKK